MTEDLCGEVSSRLLLFAYEFHWTPAQVWALTFAEFCGFADFLDDQQDQRRAAKR